MILTCAVCTWVARWLLFKPKIIFWVNFVGSCNGIYWYILWLFGIPYSHLEFFCGHLLYLFVIPYTFPVLVCCAKKNLATLVCTVCTCAHQSIDIYVSTFRCDRNLKQLDKIWYSNFGGQKVRWNHRNPSSCAGRTMFSKKGIIFSADLQLILQSGERFWRALKIVPWKYMNYLV
jgi:hypothetical protein